MIFRLKKLFVHHKILLGIAGILALFVVFYYSILIPQQTKISQLTAVLQSEQRRVGVIEAFAGAHPDISQYEQELNAKLATVNLLLPDQPKISEFIVTVEQAARASGLELQQIKPLQPVKKTGYREIPLELTVQGTYFPTLDFLKKLEGLERFNSVVNMTVQAQTDQLTSDLRINIYYYDEPQPPEIAEQAKVNTATTPERVR
ncbi:type 4a pilus biogenesis protein PilO|uniref:Type IV pilus assembly protein PilO n=1 Tax=Dendrosporobacter quercicolus TaxID=146817 RepID=A0A1G9LF49_9FIRM|nr:type 4a pilus biogenesis protein PilO [Dendrosporobacter quercicolus]NSL46693.1 type 4a pilus biogenesis protein PilO [Dendrosporobacter quercicolus DSM 1736]SDL60571.1 type IV pilus assembly protein PilO [Dendrosporobacter quercicolus]